MTEPNEAMPALENDPYCLTTFPLGSPHRFAESSMPQNQFHSPPSSGHNFDDPQFRVFSSGRFDEPISLISPERMMHHLLFLWHMLSISLIT